METSGGTVRLFKSPNNAVSNRALEVKSSILLSRSDPQASITITTVGTIILSKRLLHNNWRDHLPICCDFDLGSRHELEEARDRNLGSSVSG